MPAPAGGTGGRREGSEDGYRSVVPGGFVVPRSLVLVFLLRPGAHRLIRNLLKNSNTNALRDWLSRTTPNIQSHALHPKGFGFPRAFTMTRLQDNVDHRRRTKDIVSEHNNSLDGDTPFVILFLDWVWKDNGVEVQNISFNLYSLLYIAHPSFLRH